jgi:hypothetical protein
VLIIYDELKEQVHETVCGRWKEFAGAVYGEYWAGG